MPSSVLVLDVDAPSSPDSETFSTPPSTPTMSSSSVSDGEPTRPSLSRRSSRPTSLQIDKQSADWKPDVLLEENSPDVSKVSHRVTPGGLLSPGLNGSANGRGAASPAVARHASQLTPQPTQSQSHIMSNVAQRRQDGAAALKSPCFVHSHLDKGASFADWLRSRPAASQAEVTLPVHQAHQALPVPSIHNIMPGEYSANGSAASSPTEWEEDEDPGSLTRQLAETAVGVREMSKQLGRARVRTNIQNVLIVTKARDNRLIKLTRELAIYLMKKPRKDGRGLVVYVDNQLRHSKRFDAAGIEREHPELFVPSPRRRSSSSNSISSMTSSFSKDEFAMKDEGQLRYWTSEMCSRSPHLFDFVVTLGGDGTVLFTSWLFQRIVPPVLSFALGSLGFLTNFDFADYPSVMDTVIDSGIRVNLRMRFTCTVYRAVAPEEGKGRRAVKNGETGEIMMRNIEKGGWEALEGGWSGSGTGERDAPRECKAHKDKEIMCFTTRPVESFEVLNDLVVDRGPSPYVSLLELFGDEHHMTTVQADGLTVSTPTGSTAYSLSAGGSLVHPEIPAILITPICPHTLSFRPMLLPDSMELRICVPFNSRSTAWASFDGRGRVELKQGDHIKITASKFPFPTVCADKQSTDWFHAISRTLKWNERERQKSFVVVEEGPAVPKKRKEKLNHVDASSNVKLNVNEVDEEDEVSDEEEEEEKFDIDDSSPEANTTATEDVAKMKAQEMTQPEPQPRPTARDAALALSKGNPLLRARSSSRQRGIDSPDRFAGPHPHPPRLSPRHVSFQHGGRLPPAVPGTGSASSASTSGDETLAMHEAQKGDRDHIHSPQLLSGGRSRIPRDRDVDAESMRTPTAFEGAQGSRRGHHRGGSKDYDGGTRRAFAVWGHDESDSNASDSDI